MAEAKLNRDLLAEVAGFITVHNYDETTREYLSSSREYLALGVGLPARACADAPGAPEEGRVFCRTADLTAWELLPDHRGETVYSTVTGEPVEITLPGDYPAGTTRAAPATRFDVWNGKAWVTNEEARRAADVEDAKATKSRLRSAANEFISQQQWPSRLTLGRLSAQEQAAFTAWLDYLEALESVDTTYAPDIAWPGPPEKPGG
ncbi:tail fiber assembly protein [Cronobacter dublinensis]|uniref:tail fiber assembly protein n=1 Tax=Cronobacter dublinensis TaxID=413497 RepID=UPI000CFFCC68|nr:tail fiber assembly protein [Cronobacter dublinensis]EKY3086948.1 tail fiber assembly protein [Cronobacter dublinensis]